MLWMTEQSNSLAASDKTLIRQAWESLGRSVDDPLLNRLDSANTWEDLAEEDFVQLDELLQAFVPHEREVSLLAVAASLVGLAEKMASQEAPIIHVYVPETQVNVTNEPANVQVHVPEQPAPIVDVHLPEAPEPPAAKTVEFERDSAGRIVSAEVTSE